MHTCILQRGLKVKVKMKSNGGTIIRYLIFFVSPKRYPVLSGIRYSVKFDIQIYPVSGKKPDPAHPYSQLKEISFSCLIIFCVDITFDMNHL